MKKIVLISILTLPALAAPGQQTHSTFDWNAPGRKPDPAYATVVTNEGRVCLKIERTEDKPATIPLLTIEKPAISNTLYAVSGEIKHDGVEGGGYLEMWSVFPSGRFFSRTLGSTGPTKKITGSSDWRPFVLPFDRSGTTELPTRLEINAFLPGRGTLWVQSVKFTDYPYAQSLGAVLFPGGWWSPLTGAGIIAAGLALAAGLGVGLGLLARVGKARGVVLPLAGALSVLGLGAALAGAVGWVAGQPEHVWAVLGLLAIVMLAVFPFLFNRLRKRYAELELRRMISLDAQS
jgi:hypothetical protein